MPTETTAVPAPAAPAANPLDAVLARNREKADYGTAAEPPKTKTAEIKADDAVVRRVSKLEGEAIEHKATIAKLETTAKQAEALLQVQKLWKDGKRTEAIALLAEADPTETMEKLLEDHLSQQTDATESALAARVDEIKKQVDADAQARKDFEAAQAKKSEAEAQASTLAFATHALDAAVNEDGTPKFELCSRAKNREGAAKLAIEHAVALAVKRGLDVDALTPDATRALLQDAYADVEAEIEAEGVERQREVDERYKRTPKAPAPRAQQQTPQSAGPPGNGEDRGRQEGQQTSRPQPIPAPGLRTEKPKPAYSLEAVLAKNNERARY
jgi:hypothetical protein